MSMGLANVPISQRIPSGMSQSFKGCPTLVDHVLAIREEIKLLETSVEARDKVLKAIEATDLSQAQSIEQAISLIIKTYSADPHG